MARCGIVGPCVVTPWCSRIVYCSQSAVLDFVCHELSIMASSIDTPIVCPVIVGRAPLLVALDAHLAAARDGRGGTVVIAGEAGIGKSRLVTEVRTREAARDMLVLVGRCFEPDRVLPYAPLLDM